MQFGSLKVLEKCLNLVLACKKNPPFIPKRCLSKCVEEESCGTRKMTFKLEMYFFDNKWILLVRCVFLLCYCMNESVVFMPFAADRSRCKGMAASEGTKQHYYVRRSSR